MPDEVWLVRHGQSAANAGLPTDDPGAIPLTAQGVAQAQAFADALPAGEYAVWTSTYVRARDTAAPTLARLDRAAREHPLLHEFVTLCPARCAGTTYRARMPWVDAYWMRGDPDFRDGPGAETFREFATRVRDVRRDLHDQAGTTLVFGHGMFFAQWIWQALGFPWEDRAAMAAFRRFQLGLPMPNAGVYRFSRHGAGWQLQVDAARLRQVAPEPRPEVAIQ